MFTALILSAWAVAQPDSLPPSPKRAPWCACSTCDCGCREGFPCICAKIVPRQTARQEERIQVEYKEAIPDPVLQKQAMGLTHLQHARNVAKQKGKPLVVFVGCEAPADYAALGSCCILSIPEHDYDVKEKCIVVEPLGGGERTKFKCGASMRSVSASMGNGNCEAQGDCGQMMPQMFRPSFGGFMGGGMRMGGGGRGGCSGGG